jgi:hypothetical protein
LYLWRGIPLLQIKINIYNTSLTIVLAVLLPHPTSRKIISIYSDYVTTNRLWLFIFYKIITYRNVKLLPMNGSAILRPLHDTTVASRLRLRLVKKNVFSFTTTRLGTEISEVMLGWIVRNRNIKPLILVQTRK